MQKITMVVICPVDRALRGRMPIHEQALIPEFKRVSPFAVATEAPCFTRPTAHAIPLALLQEEATKRETKRAFEAGLRAFVTKPSLLCAPANATRRSGTATRRR